MGPMWSVLKGCVVKFLVVFVLSCFVLAEHDDEWVFLVGNCDCDAVAGCFADGELCVQACCCLVGEVAM